MSLPLLTRREAIRLGGAALFLSPWVSHLSAADGPPAFEFIAVNDTHYIDENCRAWQSRVVTAMKESSPQAAFCLMAGDLTDLGDRASCEAIRDEYGKLGCPIHPVPGNHDFISDTDRSGYDAVFSGKLNYGFAHGGWQFLGLDSTQGTQFSETKISDATLAWVDDQIKKLEPARPTMVFTHFPLGDGTEMRPVNADALLQRLTKFNLRWVHSGHWHAESAVTLASATMTTSRCCARLRGNRDGSPLKGWHVYRAAADGTLSRRFVPIPV